MLRVFFTSSQSPVVDNGSPFLFNMLTMCLFFMPGHISGFHYGVGIDKTSPSWNDVSTGGRERLHMDGSFLTLGLTDRAADSCL